jgi:aspartyl-tRNA(Asn)/glutamyl-tRNA(Gln) amidotransferase subunit B
LLLEPFARNGTVVLYPYDGIAAEDGERAAVGLERIQLEQDTGKSTLQSDNVHLLDFNRVSHPLIEIVSLPQMHHPSTAAAFVRKVQWTLKAVGACTLGMELGGLRADVNISVRRRAGHDRSLKVRQNGHTEALGRRTEIKNLSSFKAVEEAIEAERDRQVAILEAGGLVEGETRGWTLGGRETVKLRDKEGVVDYRYLPDPDLPPLRISEVCLTSCNYALSNRDIVH